MIGSKEEERMEETAPAKSFKRLPQFYCAGTNGRVLISEVLLALGWEQRTKQEVTDAKQKISWQR